MDMRQFGGTPIYKGGIPVSADPAAADGWNFGWLPLDADGFVIDRDGEVVADERTAVQAIVASSCQASMPKFEIKGRNSFAGQKAFLWEFALKARGSHDWMVNQITGSCVGAAGGNMATLTTCIERVRLGDPDKVAICFWPLPYGRSRFYLGQRSQGEGSTGATFAKAAQEDGFLDADETDLPKYTRKDGKFLVWGRETELRWSDGSKISDAHLTRSRKHPFKTVARIKSADEARDALQNGYCLSLASSWGGLMECPAEGEPKVRLNRRSGTWMHQMSCCGWWDHPTLGQIFNVLNQWAEAHGLPLNGEPNGSFWTKFAEFDWICRNGEVFAFSQFDGFPANDIFSWYA